MADPLVEVAVRVYADVAEHVTLAEVPAIIAGCRSDLDAPSAAALPEMVERLARQRLATRRPADGAEHHRDGNLSTATPAAGADLID